MAKASGTFHVESWDEQTYAELAGGGKLTRASVTQTFAGSIAGAGSVEYLMCSVPGATTRVLGLQRVEGRVGERSGSFVLETVATFDGREVRGAWSVVSGSGTGELPGLRGDGAFTAPLGSDASFSLDYELA
jgi:hypothetical protein